MPVGDTRVLLSQYWIFGASLSEPHMGSKSVPRELSIYLYTMGSHKIKGFFSGIFGIYHQDQRKEEFQLHLLVKFIYSLGVYELNQWEGMEHPPGHCSKTATLPSKKGKG